MKIAICAKDSALEKTLSHYFSELRPKFNTQLFLYSFPSPEMFFATMDQGYRYDIVLMDVDTFGTKAARILREKYLDDLALLIYITDRQSRLVSFSETNFFTFLQKPIFNEEFQEKVGRACSLVLQIQGMILDTCNQPLFTYKINRDIYQVNPREIVYLQSDLREIELCLWSFEREKIIKAPHYYGKLDDEAKKLPSDIFFRVHKSYVVNSRFIRKITKQKTLTLIEGTEIPISAQYQKRIGGQISSLLNIHTV